MLFVFDSIFYVSYYQIIFIHSGVMISCTYVFEIASRGTLLSVDAVGGEGSI